MAGILVAFDRNISVGHSGLLLGGLGVSQVKGQSAEANNPSEKSAKFVAKIICQILYSVILQHIGMRIQSSTIKAL